MDDTPGIASQGSGNQLPVVVIGAGPAGLMAAGTAARSGNPVLLIEKNSAPGLKLNLTGQGRCNFTNSASLTDFLSHCYPDRRWLKRVFQHYFSSELIAFFKSLQLPAVEEDNGRLFPACQSAAAVTDALVSWCRSSGVRFLYHHKIVGVHCHGHGVSSIRVKAPKADEPVTIAVRGVIIATGGCSYPRTGSNGDGHALARFVGHTVVDPLPALVRLLCEDVEVHECSGISLADARLDLWSEGSKIAARRGELLFTHTGLSGPAALSMSRDISRLSRQNIPYQVTLDLLPQYEDGKLDRELVSLLNANGKKQTASVLKGLIPAHLAEAICTRCSIDPTIRCHQITAVQRKAMRNGLKHFEISNCLSGSFTEAMVTTGGVALQEVTPSTCGSKLVPNLFFAGEVLDCDADTGGYNLQIAFSTGYCAGMAV